MSGTEARAADDATPDDPHHGLAATPADESPDDEPQPDPDPDPDTEPDPDPDAGTEPEPSWWHRSHPTFAGLVGFFTGVAYVIIVPGVYAALLGLLVSDSTAQKLFPLVLLALVVPIALLVPRKTRRFAQFMFLGIISTAVVIAATAGLVIWALIRIDG